MGATRMLLPSVVFLLPLGVGLAGCDRAPDHPSSTREAGPWARFAGTSPSIRFDDEGVLRIAYAVEHQGHPSQVAVRRLGRDLSPPVFVSELVDLDIQPEVGPVLAPWRGSDVVVAYPVNVEGGRWSSELVFQLSSDGGETWTRSRLVHDDGRLVSHSYADLTRNGSGAVVASWLDDRSGHQGVRTAVLTPEGGTPNRSVDDFTCECCRTTLLTAKDGTVWLAYRDRGEGNVRNVSYAVSRDGGTAFEQRGPIAEDRWVLDGCPDSGPRLAETADGAVWAAWFNGARNAIQVAAARGGKFAAPQVIESAGADLAKVNHPEIGTLPDGRLVVFYEAADGKGRSIRMRIADAAGSSWTPPRVVARDASGPRFTSTGQRGALAFTARAAGGSDVVIVDADTFDSPTSAASSP